MTGSGTAADPYIIYDVDDLQAVENDPYYYELANDIDASETSGWNAGAGFNPLGDAAIGPHYGFVGHLDGKGHKITSLFINRPTEDAGLFDTIVDGGEVKNLGIEDCDITGNRAGGMVRSNGGTITNCYTTGSVAAVRTTWGEAGGFVMENLGYFGAGEISNCYSTCTVACERAGGGFARHNDGVISKCYALGAVSVTWPSGIPYVGGFVGSNGAHGVGTISDCYARGDVEATGDYVKASGFVHTNSETIERCYSTGAVTATGDHGETAGFCYYNGGTISDCFWDTESSGESSSDGGTGKTTAEMKIESTFTDAGWDFTTPIWYIGAAFNNGYPAFEGVLIPTVTTDPATGRGTIAATINGTLSQDGGEVCECGLEWGLSTEYGTITPTESKTTGETFSQVIGGLFPNTTYHFRAFATNSVGTSHGADRSFATALVISKAHALARREL